ncbi:Thiol peroxidase [Pyrodictium delaneyi]|uniref:thioredoxin-dependent peroxiredoxin n=1 Tax=Pyrodictium delaneyi TaxID=1273541 RepID=A0A0P0N2M1_9CREN|nr:peroxiredoxin [Pyrodictium delaneyi]ALL00526.1 Thiol peroxidase [Pyrodictium delaneyi]OWJ53991.1 peroxiredoxin [Pyrodictium delaneyi]
MTPEPGAKAPVFEAVTHLGSKLRLDELRGQIVVLYFYPRAMTSGCTREAQRFNELLEEFTKHNAIVLGISTDPPERNRRFAEKLGLRFTLLSDPDGEIARLYGVLKQGSKRVGAERVTFIIDQHGRIAKVIAKVRPAEKHADLALEAVRGLSARQ